MAEQLPPAEREQVRAHLADQRRRLLEIAGIMKEAAASAKTAAKHLDQGEYQRFLDEYLLVRVRTVWALTEVGSMQSPIERAAQPSGATGRAG